MVEGFRNRLWGATVRICPLLELCLLQFTFNETGISCISLEISVLEDIWVQVSLHLFQLLKNVLLNILWLLCRSNLIV